MKKKLFSIALGVITTILMVSCESERPELAKPQPIDKLNEWIHDMMANNYLWSPNDANNEMDPDAYFSEAKYSKDDVSKLWRTDSEIVTKKYDIGFEYGVNNYKNDNKTYYIIYYVKKGSNAEAQGLKRGYLITKVNGNNIPTDVNEALTFMQNAYKNGENVKFTVMVPRGTTTLDFTIQPQAKSNAENPLYTSKVVDAGSKKVGYMLYNEFNPGDKYTFDNAVASKLQEFYDANVNCVIVDLRYNLGGNLSSALALASGLVKNGRNTSDAFVIHKRRADLNKDFNDNFIAETKGGVAIPDLGSKISKLYVITGKSTGATSDIFINSLKSYWGNDLVIVGHKTQGASPIAVSQTVTSKNITNTPDEWSMSIAISYMANKDGKYDYTNGFAPNIEILEVNDENTTKLLGDFGTKDDDVFAKAIADITLTRSLSVERSSYNNDNLVSSIESKPLAGRTIVEIEDMK